MRNFTLFKLAVAGMLLSAGSVVKADILAGVGWAANQTNVTCYLFNAGPGSVTVSSKVIFNEISGSIPITSSCGTSLGAGKTCWFGANVAPNGSHACYSVVNTSAANVRGEIEIRNALGNILNSGVLR